MKKFFVYIEDEFDINDLNTWTFINAENKEEAIKKFTNYFCIKDETFLEEIYGYYLESGLCENFFEQVAPKDEANEKLNRIWKENVIKFFGQNKKWGDLFIRSAFLRESITFPNEMIFYIANNCWYKSTAIDVDDPEFNLIL